MKKPVVLAMSSLVAMSVPTVSGKVTTSEMRKEIIRANMADVTEEEEEDDVPTLDPPNPEKPANDPDLITVSLTQDGMGTKIDKVKNDAQKKSSNLNFAQTKTSESTSEIPSNKNDKFELTKSDFVSLRSYDLVFDKNSAKLKKGAYPVLEDVKAYAEKNDFLVSVVGYTDTTGMKGYNKRLSKKRAESVSSRLLNIGLAEDRIVSVLGRGEKNPVSSNDTEEGRVKNRRVEFKFIKKGQI
ncbi:OmpA family protein [Leptotrichia sp. oral taxon 847]|uniref:OmpA family protein n=1 Tax=Leptotrichia sp. oral taxon 847 TaxID=1785996 RepID=UPI000767F5D6|nr:OmpA family protein [Leptotrichia sp. oral taxon 847]AMD95826.1 flagellar motor protein MotB [Leptotrichia sp. oral taxon 847]